MPNAELHRVRNARIAIVDASPEDNALSDIYEIQVFGVSVLIRRREHRGGRRLIPYIHIEDQSKEQDLILVEVNNGGEHECRTPTQRVPK
ncbi:hypothetical protein OG800_50555 (plasmid) [Streptomyces sp. NBC_00445]|uniref:hypothetical protein n=1 Tax=Streptomyces sp. NBC_00445 TaxID=2975745 RepID=UPI002E20C3BD